MRLCTGVPPRRSRVPSLLSKVPGMGRYVRPPSLYQSVASATRFAAIGLLDEHEDGTAVGIVALFKCEVRRYVRRCRPVQKRRRHGVLTCRCLPTSDTTRMNTRRGATTGFGRLACPSGFYHRGAGAGIPQAQWTGPRGRLLENSARAEKGQLARKGGGSSGRWGAPVTRN
jgi:hypothetical protein